jgi:DNA-binding CsgD family transcriptional regulator
MGHDRVFSVHGAAELDRRAGHLLQSARSEFLCASRDLKYWLRPEADGGLHNSMHAAFAADITRRKLLSPFALADEAVRGHLRQVHSEGVAVRIGNAALPNGTILIDRRVMILTGPPDPVGGEYTVITSPMVIEGFVTLFEAIWDTAIDLDAYLHADVPHLDEAGRVILRALASGLTDEPAARRLGISIRTYRRRVADLMTRLEATSRFQAGLRAGQLGLPASDPSRPLQAG